jgi:hypothetical protein
MSLYELQEWLGHRLPSSTQRYAKRTKGFESGIVPRAGRRDCRNLSHGLVSVKQQTFERPN